jgi:CO/xanthine dehydrogenase FAD-binding subunit
VTASLLVACSLSEALAALAEGARPIAGGTDLVVAARQGKTPLPRHLVAIHRLPELAGVQQENGLLRLGALASHAEIAAHPVVRERLSALADASAIVGSPATRAWGTVGGNLMNASPAMETGGPLVCLDAEARLVGPQGERRLAVTDLLVGPGETTASPDELLTEVEVPLPAPGTGSAYLRLGYRRQMEIAVVGAAAALRLEEGRVAHARVAITALAPTIRRVPAAEEVLLGSDAGPQAAEEAARAAAAAAEPISDVRASRKYRRAMAEVIVRRAVALAAARARGEVVPIPAGAALEGGVR